MQKSNSAVLQLLDKASDLYYAGTPIISDIEFDRLAEENDYISVGHIVHRGIKHIYPMKSLQKCFDINNSPLDINLDKLVATAKLDGAAVSLVYVEGTLLHALTRGDGKEGLDITDKLKHLIPHKIQRKGILQITGEVVAHKDVPNARNFAAGALNLKEESEFLDRVSEGKLVFIAYEAQENTCQTWTQEMKCLSSNSFKTVWTDMMFDYPQDGTVFRIDNYREYYKMGETSHHPKGSFALKQIQEGVVTELLDVVWQTGKSGVVTPVAILEPVVIGEATVSRATLHNMEYIRGLNLEIGCMVEVIRSGEIIPRIVRRVEEK